MRHVHGKRYTACGLPLADLDSSDGDECAACAMAGRVGSDMRWRTGRALRTAARDWSDRAVVSDTR